MENRNSFCFEFFLTILFNKMDQSILLQTLLYILMQNKISMNMFTITDFWYPLTFVKIKHQLQ